MDILNLISYELLGPKEEFAGWVSNISPHDTPFTSLTGKARVHNRVFEWQTDRLEVVQKNAWEDSRENLPTPSLVATVVHNNYTQIFRKVVTVSDTANSFKNHGRQSELEYQFEKASKEIKRDLEWTLLSSQEKDEGVANNTRLMSGFYRLVADVDAAEPTTGAITHKRLSTDSFTEDDIFDITRELYMAGARANVIMYHPVHASMFNKFFEHGTGRVELYTNEDETVPNILTEIVDPLGQKFILFPNRYMGKNIIYFFHPHDWFQRVLRAPTTYSTDKTGSSEAWVIEMEVSLQHRNPWASGILELSNYYGGIDYVLDLKNPGDVYVGTPVQLKYTSTPSEPLSVTWSSSDDTVATVDSSGVVTALKTGDVSFTVTANYPFGLIMSSTVDTRALRLHIDMPLVSQALLDAPTPIALSYATDITEIPTSITWSTSVPIQRATFDAARTHININRPDTDVDVSVSVDFPTYGILEDTVYISTEGFRAFPPNKLDRIILGEDKIIDPNEFLWVNPETLNSSGRFIFEAATTSDSDAAEIIETGDEFSGWVYTIHTKAIKSNIRYNVKLYDDPTLVSHITFSVVPHIFDVLPYTGAPLKLGDTAQLQTRYDGPDAPTTITWQSSRPYNVSVDQNGLVTYVNKTSAVDVSIQASAMFPDGTGLGSGVLIKLA